MVDMFDVRYTPFRSGSFVLLVQLHSFERQFVPCFLIMALRIPASITCSSVGPPGDSASIRSAAEAHPASFPAPSAPFPEDPS